MTPDPGLSEPPSVPSQLARSPFWRPPAPAAGPGRFLIASLAGFIGVEAVAVATSLVSLVRFDQRQAAVASNQLTFAEGFRAGTDLAWFGTFLVCGLAWLIWQHRAHTNLSTLGPTRFRPAVIWWALVPVASLFMPFRAVSELAQAGHDRPTLRRWWWGLFIINNVISVGALQLDRVTDINARLLAMVGIVTDVVWAIDSVLAIRVVSLIDQGLKERRAEAGWPAGPAPLSARVRLSWGIGAAGLAALGALSMGTVLPLVVQSLETVSTNTFQFSVGGCFDDIEDGYRSVECHEPHQAEAYLLLTHPDQLTYPGEQGLTDWAEPLCYSRFDDYTGIDYQNSALDFGYLYPTAGAWAGGDHEIVCYLYDPGGDDLTEPIGRAGAA